MLLLHLLHDLKLHHALCFTSSLETTHRLFLLLSQFPGIQIAEYSGSLGQKQKNGILKDFISGKVQL